MTQKVIRGKRYDTDTATEIATWNNSIPSNDLEAIEETLYRTPKGAYFLLAAGGAMTKYARRAGSNSWSGSSDIFIELSDADALKWCEESDVPASIISENFTLEDA